MRCDLLELLACGHDGKIFGWEVCNIQNLMQEERKKGTPEDAQIMKEYVYICPQKSSRKASGHDYRGDMPLLQAVCSWRPCYE
jgi:hypothetical protein